MLFRSQLFTGVLTIFGTIGFMLSISVKITVIVILLTPISLFVASFIAGRTFRMFQEQSEKRAEMTSIVEELVGNQKIVQAFSYEERANERFGKVNEELRVCGIKAIFFSSITNPSTRFVNGLVYTDYPSYAETRDSYRAGHQVRIHLQRLLHREPDRKSVV